MSEESDEAAEEVREEVREVFVPIRPREVTTINAWVRYGRPQGSDALGFYGLISIPGVDHPVLLGPHETEAAAHVELRKRLAAMSEQISAQGFVNDVVEVSDQGRD